MDNILEMKRNLRIERRLNTTKRCRQQASVSSGVERGFTLVEVMVVVAILGVMATVGLPAFQEALHNGATKSAARSLIFHMKQARVTAMAESRGIVISIDDYSYSYDTYTSGTCSRCKNLEVLYSSFTGGLTMSSNVNSSTATFSAQGTAGASTITITSGSSSEAVTINIVGRAYVQ